MDRRSLRMAALVVAMVTTGTLVPGTAAVARGDVSGIDIRVPAETSVGSMTGRVIAAADGTPVRGASLWIEGPDGSGWAETGPDGRWRMRRVRAGAYRLAVEGSGAFQDGWYADGAPGSFVGDRESATWITIRKDETVAIRIALPVGADVRGRLLGLSQEDAFGAGVELYQADEPLAGAEPVEWADMREDGSFRIRGVRPGRYLLAVDPPWEGELQSGCYRRGAKGGFTADCTKATILTIGLDGLAGIVVEPPRSLAIIGRLEDASGQPVCGEIWVRQVDAPVGWRDGDGTEDCGAFRIRGLNAGRYVLGVAGAAGVNIRTGWYAAGADGRWTAQRSQATAISVTARTTLEPIRPPSGATISGWVGGGGADADRTWAIAVPVDRSTGTAWAWSVRAPGGFRIVGLAPGAYRLALVATAEGVTTGCAWYDRSDWRGRTWDLDRATILTVGADGVEGIEASLSDGFRMGGQVTSDAGPISDASVRVVPAPALRLLWKACAVYWEPDAMVDDDGSWSIAGLPAGAYLVRVSTYDDALADGWYRAGTATGFTRDRAKATWVRLGR